MRVRYGIGLHPEWFLVLPHLSILEEGDEGTYVNIDWLIFSLCINIIKK